MYEDYGSPHVDAVALVAMAMSNVHAHKNVHAINTSSSMQKPQKLVDTSSSGRFSILRK